MKYPLTVTGRGCTEVHGYGCDYGYGYGYVDAHCYGCASYRAPAHSVQHCYGYGHGHDDRSSANVIHSGCSNLDRGREGYATANAHDCSVGGGL